MQFSNNTAPSGGAMPKPEAAGIHMYNIISCKPQVPMHVIIILIIPFIKGFVVIAIL